MRIADHEHDLAGEDPAPREVGRAEAADQRADRHRHRARCRHEPVGRGPLLGREVPRDERDDRGQDQRRPDPLQERPAEEQDGQALRDRRREGAAAVDHAADRERALAADDRSDLGAGDHQRRHHERVRRDRALDPGHGRAHVLRDRRDRDVHHRAVQRHQELPARERQEHEHGRRRAPCERVHRNDPSVLQSQLSKRSRPPSGGTPRCERAMSGSNSRSSSSSAVSALCASIMISLLR